MYTPSKAYVTKLSSGTVLALLAFSGLLIAIPLVSSVHAANASAPTLTWNIANQDYGDVVPGGATDYWYQATITNPASNQFAITSVTMTSSFGFVFNSCDYSDQYFENCASSTNSATWYTSSGSSNTPLPPGASDYIEWYGNMPTFASYPTTVSWTVAASDSSGGTVNGATIKTVVIDPSTTETFTPTSPKSYTAGSSAVSFSVSLSPAQAGVPIYFLACAPGSPAYSWCSFGATDYSTSATWSVAQVRVLTGASGSASTTFQPNNVMADGTHVWLQPEIGLDCNWDCANIEVNTVAGSPSQMTITLPGSGDSTAPNHYETNHATDTATHAGAYTAAAGISYAIADKFTNPIDFSTLSGSQVITFTALSGGGRFDLGNGTVTSFKCKSTGTTTCPTTGLSGTLAFNYYQSTTYGSIGKISATLTDGTLSLTGVSGEIITSTFITSSPTPKVSPSTDSGDTNNVAAGSSVLVSADLTAGATLPAQMSVPVTFYLCTTGAACASYVAVNGDGTMSATGTSDKTGNASASFAVDTGKGAVSLFLADVPAPIDGDATNMLGNSTAASTAVTTISGAAASFNVEVKYTAATLNDGTTPNIKNAVNGTTVYVNVYMSDAYGNLATNPGPYQVQITLTPPSGSVLTATTVYISSGQDDTAGSIGPIAWTLPKGIASGLTLTAAGVLNGGTKTSSVKVNTVSALPTLSVTQPLPLSGVIYSSSSNVVFSGQANASVGYPTTVTITSIGYKVGSGTWQSAPIASGNQIDWSLAATFPSGLSTIMFNATDSKSNTVVSQSYKVLIDTAAPTVAFTTKANSNLTGGSPAMATIVDPEGDLNATSVSVTVNGTAVAASGVIVSGANNLGHNTTYTVTIKNLPTGSDNLAISATDYAGLSGSDTVTVNVIVPFSQSVVINSAAKGTLGSFTGVSVSATNLWSTSQNLVVFAVWKNSAGQTVAVTTGGLTLASGATGTTFAPLAGGLPTGSYTVSVFVITTSNNPVSSSTSITATV